MYAGGPRFKSETSYADRVFRRRSIVPPDKCRNSTDLLTEPRNVTTPRAKVKRGEVTHRGYVTYQRSVSSEIAAVHPISLQTDKCMLRAEVRCRSKLAVT
jgi:hypothetical protein